MSDFADVVRFARAHTTCGGVTPKATTQTGGGYRLALTCACGATMDRLITAEEARMPLPFPPSAPPPAKAPERPKAPAPSDDLQEALRQALEAEDAAAARTRPSPTVPASRSPEPGEALGRAVHAEPPARPPSHVPISELEEAVQRALEADARAAAAEAEAAARARQRAVPPRLNLDAAMQRAVESQIAVSVTSRPAPSRFWFGALVVVLVVGGVVFWLALRALEEDARLQTRESPSTVASAAAASEAERAAFAEAMRALKDVQAASTATVAYAVYSSRVAFAKSDVDRYLGTAAAPELKADVRDTMQLHSLAAAAWRARTLDSKDAWEAVGQDPALDLCPAARRVIDFAQTPVTLSQAHARGLGVAAAIPLLWECAGARLSVLERASSG